MNGHVVFQGICWTNMQEDVCLLIRSRTTSVDTVLLERLGPLAGVEGHLSESNAAILLADENNAAGVEVLALVKFRWE